MFPGSGITGLGFDQNGYARHFAFIPNQHKWVLGDGSVARWCLAAGSFSNHTATISARDLCHWDEFDLLRNEGASQQAVSCGCDHQPGAAIGKLAVRCNQCF
jgi:hypothetical protein